jgi:Flp pilus assembly pilin Flp
MCQRKRNIKKNQRGGNLVEYSLLATAIAILTLAAVRELGNSVTCGGLAKAGWYLDKDTNNALYSQCNLSSLP